jgi:predicted N-acetyltransferase YhbS
VFRGSSQDAVADDDPTPTEMFVPFQTDGLVLVAEDAGEVVGFASCQACADALHLWELAVRHDRQGRGLGAALVRGCADLARSRGLGAVTLTTFKDIPWNGPYYRRLGFAELADETLNPRMSIIRRREADLGLEVDARCAMQLQL